MSENAQHDIRGAAAVIEHNGRVLIAKRQEGDTYGGCWEFPGGKLRNGETPEACVVREVAEEVALQVRVLEPCGQIRDQSADYSIVLDCFRCEVVSGEATPQECQAVAWVEPQALPNYEFPPPNAELVTTLATKAVS